MASRSKHLPLILECVFPLLQGIQAAVDLPPVKGEKEFPSRIEATDWTSLEDEVLRRAHQKHGEVGYGKWRKVSGYFTRKDHKQCCNRWRRSLDPHKKPRKRGGTNPSPSVVKNFDSEYKELVCKSNLVTKVRFHSTERLIEIVVDSILFFAGCW